ncbi:MAG: RNA-binding protein [Desulfobacterales bacterium]|nr:RNA-binding protein [Desulfobacterales bacterium]
MTEETTEKTRLDRWLWAARFYKSRSLATRAVSGGLVRINGERSKPSRGVRTGDELTIRRGDVEFVVLVLELSEKRGPARIARTLYEETGESVLAREKARQMRRILGPAAMLHAPEHRPGKRDRRKIRSFTRKDE